MLTKNSNTFNTFITNVQLCIEHKHSSCVQHVGVKYKILTV